MPTRVLLVGRGLFRDGLARVLDEEPSLLVVGSASSWSEAEDLISQTQPEVLIVDQAAIGSRTTNVYALLGNPPRRLRIVHLTLDENRAVVDDLHQVSDISVTDLLAILHSPYQGQSEEATDSP
ncbi:MAG: hypothetical protein U0822_25930 [Anaerolineae bacterium]